LLHLIQLVTQVACVCKLHYKEEICLQTKHHNYY
jgi:hypothetical protein